MIFTVLIGLFIGVGLAKAPGTPEDEWSQVLKETVPAVVALRVTATRYFDTEKARSSQGTGFVVDRERGIILTNRHMVHAGPVLAEAVFLNHEEVPLEAIYRDPVHDFGFYRFDPEQVRYMDVVELNLNPQGAQVGAPIRVIGNDSGEKLSILDGTLARLDRNAPDYGRASYNDFNTFYIQAASNTSGGSSGSPVIDRNGDVVALNAGGKRTTASSFYLPLHRALRALKLIQEGKPVHRGTLQTTYIHRPFDELERLGLRTETQQLVRSEDSTRTGMLVVERVGPSGPADGALQPGDILKSVNGIAIRDFIGFESVLDESVGQEVVIVVERGGEDVESRIVVQNLHEITPSSFLEVGRAVFNELSYQLARNYHIPVGGPYLATSGYMMLNGGVPPNTVITHVDGVETASLDALREQLEQKADGQRVRFRFFSIKDHRHSYEAIAVMDRRWFPFRYCERSPGLWSCETSPQAQEVHSEEIVEAVPPAAKSKLQRALQSALVMVEFDVSYPTAGVKDLNYRGVGTVVDASRGLIVVDRDTVPVGIGDIEVTFADAIRVPGTLTYLHPTHNFAIISYEPSLLGDLAVGEITFGEADLEEGDKAYVVGLDTDGGFVSESATVRDLQAVKMLPAGTPRFRDANLDVLELDVDVSVLGGVVVNKRAEVLALWASFFDPGEDSREYLGLPASAVTPIVDALRRGEDPVYRTLGAEFVGMSFADARDRGLREAHLQAFQDADPNYRKVLMVFRRLGGSSAAEQLRDGDVLVAVDGKPVNRMGAIEELSDKESVRLTIVRDAEEVEVVVKTTALSGSGVQRIVVWAGMILHEPHYEIAAQRGMDPKGIYISWMWFGSPASKYGLRATRRILSVNDHPVESLDELLSHVESMNDRESVRVMMEGLDGSRHVGTLKLDLHYWPTLEIRREESRWLQRELQ